MNIFTCYYICLYTMCIMHKKLKTGIKQQTAQRTATINNFAIWFINSAGNKMMKGILILILILWLHTFAAHLSSGAGG